MVLEVGLEPTRCLQRRILNPVRLPIPPLQHKLPLENPVTYLPLTLQAFRILRLMFCQCLLKRLALRLDPPLFSPSKE